MIKLCANSIIPPMSAKTFALETGQILRIIDTAGRQPGDLVAFSTDDPSVKFSQARSRVENRKVAVTKGDRLWTNTFPPEVILTIVDDTFGAHDLLYTPCCRYALEKRFGVARDGCLENLANALKPWNLKSREIPDPLNIFFSVSVDETGGMTISAPMSEPGSFIGLQAAMNCVVAIATCAAPCQGRDNSGYRIEIYER